MSDYFDDQIRDAQPLTPTNRWASPDRVCMECGVMLHGIKEIDTSAIHAEWHRTIDRTIEQMDERLDKPDSGPVFFDFTGRPDGAQVTASSDGESVPPEPDRDGDRPDYRQERRP